MTLADRAVGRSHRETASRLSCAACEPRASPGARKPSGSPSHPGSLPSARPQRCGVEAGRGRRRIHRSSRWEATTGGRGSKHFLLASGEHRWEGGDVKAKCAVFLLEKMPWETEETIRVNIPGVDRGHAVSLEAKLSLSREEVMALLPKIATALRNAEVERGA